MKKKILFAFLFLGLILTASYFIVDFIQEPERITDDVRKESGGNYIQLSKGKVHYELIGKETAPLVVLIGGAGLGYDVWDHNIDALIKNNYRVLVYDHYGRGYSDKVEEQYSLNLFYSQFSELVDKLKLNDGFHLAGLSMGAMVAIKYTNQNPEKVKRLILIDPAGINPFNAPFILKTPIISDLALTFYWRPKAVNSQMQEFYQPERFKKYKEELQRQIRLRGYKKVQQSIWLNTLSVDLSGDIKKLGTLQKEILLVWGKQDPRTLIESSKHFIDALPNVKFFPVDKAGHLSNYERADIVNPRIIEFLNS